MFQVVVNFIQVIRSQTHLIIVSQRTGRVVLNETQLQPPTKLLRHFGMNENFDLENHLPQQIFPMSPLSMLLCHQGSPDETSVLPNNVE